jgi:7-cyano-7-deazaguanine reductase
MNNRITIETIAGKHLGKTSTGDTMQKYETPYFVDPTLLVGIPRELNRKDNNITTNNMHGSDIWNCWEVSFLLDNGLPVSGVLKIQYSSNSPNIVESKSLKLYLNSYNLNRIGSNYKEAINKFEFMVTKDLSNVIGEKIICKFIMANNFSEDSVTLIKTYYNWLHVETDFDQEKLLNINYDSAGRDPSLLRKDIKSTHSKSYRYCSSLLRSNCRVTNQPDWGDVFVYMKDSEYAFNPVDFLAYVVSFRNENHFHEECCELIYTDLLSVYNPKQLFVGCLYTRRGGIDINPIRYNKIEALTDNENGINHTYMNTFFISQKTMRQ